LVAHTDFDCNTATASSNRTILGIILPSLVDPCSIDTTYLDPTNIVAVANYFDRQYIIVGPRRVFDQNH